MNPLLVLVIVFSVIILAASIITCLALRARRKEQRMCFAAANNLIREKLLVDSLQNPYDDNKHDFRGNKRVMVCFRTKTSGKLQRYIFDPENGIYIGRSSTECNIFINDKSVAVEHCGIFVHNNSVYISDFNSVFGTYVKRGLFSNFDLSGGGKMDLKSGDIIEIGGVSLKITVFYFDMTLM